MHGEATQCRLGKCCVCMLNAEVHVTVFTFFPDLFLPLRVYCKFCDYLLLHAGPKGLAASSWSADIGVGGHYNSPGLYNSGRGAGKSHRYSGLQQGKSKGYTWGKPMHVTSTVSLCHCTTFILPSPFYPSVYNFLLLPRSSASSLNIPHLSAVPQPETFFWASCMATRCYCRSLLLSLPSQPAR